MIKSKRAPPSRPHRAMRHRAGYHQCGTLQPSYFLYALSMEMGKPLGGG